MAGPVIVFDGVWKKFQRGERHDSLRDVVPTLLRKTFGKRSDKLAEREFWAVRDVSFAVEPGEALGIIGPNGAGKSTTLKLLTKILKPTDGCCRIHGRVGALIEVAAGFHPDLTGRENVFLQGAIMGMKRAEVLARFDDIVEFAGVSKFVDTPVKRYSSGMNARLGFSIAAHLHPDVLIVDEVLSVGDIAFQRKCFDRMRSFLRDGVAVALVSHNLAAISQLCRRTLVLSGGEAALLAPTRESIAHYCSAQTEPVTPPTGGGVALKVDVHERPAEGMWLIAAGHRVKFSVEIEYQQAIHSASLGVVIWDLARNLYVYGASSDAVGIPPLTGQSGDRSAFDFEFDANLARGTYVVEVNVFEPALQRLIAVLRPALQFTVLEDITYDGVANVFLEGIHVRAKEISGAL